MLVFILSFIVFTITNTFFSDIKISILVFIICFLFLICFLILKYKRSLFIYSKYILLLFGSFVISLSAIVIKDYKYSSELSQNFITPSSRAESRDPLKRFLHFTSFRSKGQGKSRNDKEYNGFYTGQKLSYFIGTGSIVDTYSFGKYIFQDNNGKEYVLNTENKYQIGDKLRLVGYLKNVNLLVNKSSLSGLWSRSFDYDKWLIMKGYRGNIYEGNSIIITQNNKRDFSTSLRYGRNDSNKVGFISNIKRSLQSQIFYTYGEGRNAGLILGMLIGDKSQIPKSDYQGFIDSGLVHLIAVSGGNIIMLTIFLSFILFFLPFYFRNFIILLSIILYSFVCGMESSVMRAVLFGGLGMMALFVGREINFWRSVYIIFILMLLINPYFLLYDLGFLLSFAAIIGIRIFIHRQEKDDKNILDSSRCLDSSDRSEGQTYLIKVLKKVYNSYIKPSIGANIGIFPIIIFFMGKINLIGFITNLFVLPIVPFVMIYGFISIFLYWLIPRSGFIYIQELLINYIYKVSEIGSDYGIYLLVNDYKIKYLILILFIICLIIYMTKNKIIGYDDYNIKNRANISIKHNTKKSN